MSGACTLGAARIIVAHSRERLHRAERDLAVAREAVEIRQADLDRAERFLVELEASWATEPTS